MSKLSGIKISSYPIDFEKYVISIRNAEKILGSDVKKIHKEEQSIRKISRKSITLKNNLVKGRKISINDIIMKRPGTGLIGEKLEKVLGKKISRDLTKDYQLKEIDLK